MLSGVDHVVFRVSDVDQTVRWWSDRFGLGAERVEDWRAGRSPFVSIRVSDSLIIDLLPGEPDGTNVDHVAFVTDPARFDVFVAAYEGDIEMGPSELSGARGIGRGIYLRDPSGNRIELRTYATSGLAEGAATFLSAQGYDDFMGRYSRPLALAFADLAGVASGERVLDLGCGPGALTGVLVDRLGAARVAAVDPSPPFVADCAARFPGVDVRLGRAEEIPFDDATFDRALTQLVLHFVSAPDRAVRELRRVVRPGGLIAASVWDFDKEMEMLRHFWDAALEVDQEAPDEARTMRFGRAGEIAALLDGAGLDDVAETTLDVSATYREFAELWSGFLAGIGPAGSYCASLSDSARAAVRDGLFARVGSPSGEFTLSATARCASGVRPL